MPNTNTRLQIANASRKDEFYTQLSDIERELRHYRDHFRGKTVLCNCDDPRISNFFHYFAHNFERLGLKKLLTTCYKNQNADLFSSNESEQAIYLEYDGDTNGNRTPDPSEIGIKALKGDGDFRSTECVALLKKADVVVTNPPFSLFRQYVDQLISHDKHFLIIGHQNALTYKDIFQLVKTNQIWLGYGFNRNCAHFINRHYEDFASDADHREGMIRVSGVVWFTNLDIAKRHESLVLFKRYKGNEHEYPHYDNIDAINVDKVRDIPFDFDGLMGVPVTFVDKYNPDQFDIVGNEYDLNVSKGRGYIKGKRIYSRIFIRNKTPQT